MSDIEAFRNLDDISFIDNITIETLRQQAVTLYEKKYQEITGEKITLYPADPMRVLLNTYVLQLYQGYQYLERAAKQNLLRYSYGEYLDHIGALKGVARLKAKNAVTTVRFTLSAIQSFDIEIPQNTRVSSGDQIYFAVAEKTVIKAGTLTIDVDCVCQQSGSIGNGYEIGQLNVLVDPIFYVESVCNITESQGGSNEESDTSFSERIYLAPSAYSTAGPKEAYIYWVKTYSTLIQSVYIEMVTPGQVEICVLLENGILPEKTFLDGLYTFLEKEGVRPLTDHVVIFAPTVVSYDLDITYYISRKNKNKENDIKNKVEKAIQNYVLWQKQAIGRDINPSELVRCVMEAGAKRVEITQPIFQNINHTELAHCHTKVVTYGGLEYD